MPSIGVPTFRDKINAALVAARNREIAIARGFVPPSNTPLADPGISVVMYGDADVLPIVFAGAGDQLVLPRPKVRRVLLSIVNTLAANPINFAFGRPADNVSGVPIPAAGNAFFDNAVPQNDVHVFSPVAGTILVLYMNTNQ